jgi:integrase/recombinase XerD
MNPAELQLQQFQNYLEQRRYSKNTIKTYLECLRVFIAFHSTKLLSEITLEDVYLFNTEYILKKNCSSSYQNQVINSIKLFYRSQYKKKLDIEQIERPRREKKLPNVLSKQEVKRIIQAPVNLKHKLMLCLIYACGLRRSELLNLVPREIHSDRIASQLRHSFIGIGNRPPLHSGTIGTQQQQDDRDLHPCEHSKHSTNPVTI